MRNGNVSNMATKENTMISQQEIRKMIPEICRLLEETYVFPKIAEEITNVLKKNLESGVYNELITEDECMDQISRDMQSVNGDLNLRIVFNPEEVQQRRELKTKNPEGEFIKSHLLRLKRINYCFNELRILDGNIGYLDLRTFTTAHHGGETAVAAMNYLSNSDALIIDLRKNGGGNPEMIQLLSTYLFESKVEIGI